MGSRILILTIGRLPGSAVRSHCAQWEAAGFTASSSVAFPGFTAHQQELQLEVLHTLEIRCQNEQQTFISPMHKAGLNALPRPTELLAGPSRRLNWDSLPCPAAFPQPSQPHSKQSRHLWESIPDSPVLPNPS